MVLILSIDTHQNHQTCHLCQICMFFCFKILHISTFANYGSDSLNRRTSESPKAAICAIFLCLFVQNPWYFNIGKLWFLFMDKQCKLWFRFSQSIHMRITKADIYAMFLGIFFFQNCLYLNICKLWLGIVRGTALCIIPWTCGFCFSAWRDIDA